MYNLIIKDEFINKHKLIDNYNISTNVKKDYGVLILTNDNINSLLGSNLFISQHPHFNPLTHGNTNIYFNPILDFNIHSDNLINNIKDFINIINKELVILTTDELDIELANNIVDNIDKCVILKNVDMYTLLENCEYSFTNNDLDLIRICKALSNKRVSFELGNPNYISKDIYKKYRDLEILINIVITVFSSRTFFSHVNDVIYYYINTILLKRYLNNEFTIINIDFNTIAYDIIILLNKTLNNKKQQLLNIINNNSNENIKKYISINNIENFINNELELISITYYGENEIYTIDNITVDIPLYKLINIIDKYNTKIKQCENFNINLNNIKNTIDA